MRHVERQSVLCAWLLRLYPVRFRILFGAEILAVSQQSAREPGRLLKEPIGLLRGAAFEWRAKWNSRDYLAANQALQAQPGLPAEVHEAEKHLERTLQSMVQAIAHHQFQQARSLSNAERDARENLRLLRERYNLRESPAT